MIRIYTIVAAGLLAGLLGWLGWLVFAGRDNDQFAQCRATQVAGGAGALGGPFELIDETGRMITDTQLVTVPTLLYFGYTFCPDVCPLDTARNAEALELLEDLGHMAQGAFVSVDPGRDTPDILAEFTSVFHPRMIGLTGNAEQVRAAARAYRVFYSVPQTDDPFYLVDHSVFTYLLLPGHGFVEVFRRDQSPTEIAERTACFIRQAG